MIFTDSKKSYREKAFPEYKRRRREDRTEEELIRIKIMHEQVNLLRKDILPSIGFPVYRQTGLESDDLIAYAADQMVLLDKAIIISSDGDLWQCISNNVEWYDPQRHKLLTNDNFEEEKGIEARYWGRVKALGGCTTDGVPGLKGIGVKRAIEIIKGDRPMPKDGRYSLWKELTILPHHKTRPFELRDPEYDEDAFFAFCEKYGIDSFLEGSKRKDWSRLFAGEFGNRVRLRRAHGKKRKRKRI